MSFIITKVLASNFLNLAKYLVKTIFFKFVS